MRAVQRLLVMAALALLMPALGGAAPTDPGDAERREQLAKLRATDPTQYARLRHNLAVFQALPADRQEALRKLERDLQDVPAADRSRTDRVLERYNEWLDRLPEADRQSVLSAPDRKTRLQRIRDLRERQWVKRLPKAQADKLANTPEPARADLLKKWRQEELDERLDWQVAQRRENWEHILRNPAAIPTRTDQMPEDIREAFDKSLRPLLSRDEEKQLKDAEGKWPRFPRTLVELADMHPVAVLGPIGPTAMKDMPLMPFAASALEKDKNLKPQRDKLREAEGKWPDFGIAWRELSRSPGAKKLFPPLPNKFTPARPHDFPPEVRHFIERKLIPALDEDDVIALRQAEDKWPSYPQKVLELARKHNLQVPTTPTRFDTLDRYRWRPTFGPPNLPPRREGFWPPV